ncbi:MAG: polysaccharide deacetylase family protein [Bacteroidales bacterium]|nr:MAG: polysaccharide deacetylase family protein [Bacteroidales bacterium]
MIWRIPNSENKVYLTFDDGPNPEVTPWVLDMLGKHEAKATFFCLGRNVERYPDLFERIKDEGHSVGNHSYSHPDGWRTRNRDYFKDVERADRLIGSPLFRPPYGRITPSQIRVLKKKYKIVMWDLLSGDFDQKTTLKECVRRIKKYAKTGSIVVLHEPMKVHFISTNGFPQILNCFQGKNWNLERIYEDI